MLNVHLNVRSYTKKHELGQINIDGNVWIWVRN